MINKRAQIPATLGWVIAFLIISFILIVFLVLAIAISAKSEVLSWIGLGNDPELSIDYETGLNEIIVVNQLIYFSKVNTFEEVKILKDILKIDIKRTDNGEIEYGGVRLKSKQ